MLSWYDSAGEILFNDSVRVRRECGDEIAASTLTSLMGANL